MMTVEKAIFLFAVSAGTAMTAPLAHAQDCGKEGAPSVSCQPEESATQSHSVAVGRGSRASGRGAVAIGAESAIAAGERSIAIGYADAAGRGSVAVNGRASADRSISIGGSATGVGSIAIGSGDSSSAGGKGGVALGSHAFTSSDADRATALGESSRVEAGATNSVALGAGSVAREANVVSVGSRRIVDLAAGSDVTDAVNVGQLNAVAATASNAVSISNAASADAAGARAVAGNALSSAQAAQATAGDALNLSGANATDIQNLRRTSTAQASSISTMQAMQSAQAAQMAALQNDQAVLNDRVNALYDLRDHDRREAQSGIAAAIALSNAPMPSAPGRTSYTLNGATFRSGQAVGGSLMHRLDTQNPFAIGAGFSFGGGGNRAARIGVAGEF